MGSFFSLNTGKRRQKAGPPLQKGGWGAVWWLSFAFFFVLGPHFGSAEDSFNSPEQGVFDLPKAEKVQEKIQTARDRTTLVRLASAQNTPRFPFFKTTQATSSFGDYLSGYLALRENDFHRASDFFQEAALKDAENFEILGQAFLIRLSVGDFKGARRLSQQLILIDPHDFLARLFRGIQALKAGSYSAARRNFERIEGGALPEMVGKLLSAWAFQGAGQTVQARSILEKMRSETDAFPWTGFFANYHEGLLHVVRGEDVRASLFLTQAYAQDKSNISVVDALLRALLRSGQTVAAEELFATLPDSLREDVFFGELRKAQRTRQNPAPSVETVQQGAAELLYGVGLALMRDQNKQLAAALFQLAHFLSPNNALPILSLVTLFEDVQSHKDVVVLLKRIPKNSVFRLSADLQLGTTYEEMGDLTEAEGTFREAVAAYPSSSDAFLMLGDFLRRHEKFAQAAEIYSAAIERFASPEETEDSWILFYARGVVYERLQRWQEAERDFLRALTLSPDQPLVLNYLGYMWIERNMRLEQAFEMLHKAVGLSPGDGMILDSLGWAYYKLGRYQDAIDALEQAVVLLPQDPVVNNHLGDAYWYGGRRREALFQWTHAYDLVAAHGKDPNLSGSIDALNIEELRQKRIHGLPISPPASLSSAASSSAPGKETDAPAPKFPLPKRNLSE